MNFKNNNSIFKVSNLSPSESLIAKNVLDIHKENHCLIYNQPCLNKDSAKENHIEITFMMLSIWASEISKAMASSNKHEGTKNYYQGFLPKFNHQKTTIRLLPKLLNNDFEICGVNTIGKQQILREYAENYNSYFISNDTSSIEETSTYSLQH
ncbi:17990_t:CDS:2 [Dentiscutata erythropus]|uniref:17990_t:CDS:1 n=1 Tax=Dentiscutata erythropus TaxID=1348616 RepID=A0A9N8V6Y5_9GLOM|nr:17990_t:CDS:2 [Dentiscutata erythropus]